MDTPATRPKRLSAICWKDIGNGHHPESDTWEQTGCAYTIIPRNEREAKWDSDRGVRLYDSEAEAAAQIATYLNEDRRAGYTNSRRD